jgi:hypothetical protein
MRVLGFFPGRLVLMVAHFSVNGQYRPPRMVEPWSARRSARSIDC